MKQNIKKKKKKKNSNSPPKIDTSKSYILPISKTNSTPSKQNKQDSHISSISPPFCHVLTKTTQTKSRVTINMREKRELKEKKKKTVELYKK